MSVMYRILKRQSVLNYEGLARQHLRERLHVRDRDMTPAQDDALKQCAALGERIGSSPIETSLNFAVSLYEQWALSDDQNERSLGNSLYMALFLEMPLASMMGDVQPGMENAILDGISQVTRAGMLKFGLLE